MINWVKENMSWLKWILGILYTAFIFGVGTYVSFRETQSKVSMIEQALNTKFDMTIKILDNIVKDNEQIKNYILYREKK